MYFHLESCSCSLKNSIFYTKSRFCDYKNLDNIYSEDTNIQDSLHSVLSHRFMLVPVNLIGLHNVSKTIYTSI